MRIRFAIDWTGCLDGIHLVDFKSGEEAEIPVAVASVLLSDGRAHLSGGVKMEVGPPENKMEPGPGSNKRRGGRKRV